MKTRFASLLALWWLLNLLVLEAIANSSWPAGSDFPQHRRLGLIDFYGWAGAAALVLGLVIGIYLLVTVWCLLERRTAMDTAGLANQTVRWTLGVCWHRRIFLELYLFLLLLCVALVDVTAGEWVWALWLAAAAWAVLVMPLGVYRPRSWRRKRPPDGGARAAPVLVRLRRPSC